MVPKTVVAFVERLRGSLTSSEFKFLCHEAVADRMGFGQKPEDWGKPDGTG